MFSYSKILAAALAAILIVGCADDTTNILGPEGADDPNAAWIVWPRPSLDQWTEITAGDFHTCARRSSGAVYCWGLNNEGQVGGGTHSACSSNQPCVTRPSRIGQSIFSSASQVDAGAEHTCALTSGGAFCWGDGQNGQVGVANGVYGTYFAPTPVGGNVAFTSLSAGDRSTCGTSVSGMFCWGDIMGGVAVPWAVSSYNGYSRVSVGRLHACAPWSVGSYRGVDCWGNNAAGQIGHDPAVFGTSMIFTWGTGTGWNVVGVSTRGDYTCVNQGNTTVQCFGNNVDGTLGNGNQNTTHVPQTVGGGTQLHSVTTGPVHACALDPNGFARCWGNGNWGQLGNRVGGVRTSPVSLMGQTMGFRAIAAGARHSCAIGNDDQIYCWGDNTYGQLARGYPVLDGRPLEALPALSRVD